MILQSETMDIERKRILVVEDAPIAQKAATLILRTLNCQVDVAEDGASALRLFEANDYDLILMDIGLPDMDGFTVTKLVREKENNQSHIPIVALTANSDFSEESVFLGAGMDEFLLKPLNKINAMNMLEKFSSNQKSQTSQVNGIKMKVEKIKLGDFEVIYTNKAAAEQIISEVFDEKIYQFESKNPAPLIIDAGSNIGIATLFFKKQYPQAKIICFEPDPRAFSALQKNVETNRLENVTLISAAVSNRSGGYIEFFGDMTGDSPDSRGNSILKTWGEQRQRLDTLQVPCVRLSDYIHSEIDFLKLDVEGAETQVIEDLVETDKLKLIRSMCLEIHQCQGMDSLNDMNWILETLKAHQFTLEISEQDLSLLPDQVADWKNRVSPRLFIVMAWRNTL